MKTTALSFVFLFSLIFLFSPSWVDTAEAFHGSGLVCSKCHTMHYSENGSGPPGSDAGGPFTRLLLKQNTTNLCLTCHDNQTGYPDVMGSDVNGLTDRAAGYFAPVDQLNDNGHNLRPDEIGTSDLCTTCHFGGGSFSTAKLGCIDCHDPHGRDPTDPNYRYRNLHWASSPGSEPVIKAFVNPNATGLAVYEKSNIGYAAPPPPADNATWREVTNICLDCHHTFSGYKYTRDGNTEGGHPIRHPVTDSERGAFEYLNKHTGATDPTHWVSGTGSGFTIDRLPFLVSGATNFTEATTVAENNEVFCLTCHRAHGNANASALRWSYTGNNNSNLGCQQCHNKG